MVSNWRNLHTTCAAEQNKWKEPAYCNFCAFFYFCNMRQRQFMIQWFGTAINISILHKSVFASYESIDWNLFSGVFMLWRTSVQTDQRQVVRIGLPPLYCINSTVVWDSLLHKIEMWVSSHNTRVWGSFLHNKEASAFLPTARQKHYLASYWRN